MERETFIIKPGYVGGACKARNIASHMEEIDRMTGGRIPEEV